MKTLVILGFCLLIDVNHGRDRGKGDPGLLTWYNARNYCLTMNTSSLIVLNTSRKIEDLFNDDSIALDSKKKYWVGLHVENNHLKWSNGMTETILQIKRNKHCYYLKPNVGNCNLRKIKYDKCFKADHCNQRHMFLCEPSLHTETGQISANREASTPSITQTTTSSLSRYVKSTVTSAFYSNHTTHPSSSLLSGNGETSSVQTTSTPSAQTLSSPIEAESITLKNDVKSSLIQITSTPSVQTLSSLIEASGSTTLVNDADNNSIQTTATHVVSSSSIYVMMQTKTSVIKPTKASSLYSSRSSQTFDNKKEMVNHFRNFMDKLNTSDPECMIVLLKEYDDLSEWIDEQDGDIEYNPLTVAQSIENIALEYSKLHITSNGTKNFRISNKHIEFHAKLVESDPKSDVVFPEASGDSAVDTILLPKSIFRGQDKYIVNVVFKNNKTIRKMTPKVMEGAVDKMKWFINTDIFSSTIFPKTEKQEEDVIIKLHHAKKMKNNHINSYFGFWNFSIPTSFNGSWSQRGCHLKTTTDTYTVFACNHLTNFAVLMKLSPNEAELKDGMMSWTDDVAGADNAHQKPLMIITYIGLALSLFGEVTTVLLYCTFLNLRHGKIQIRVNLLCTLAAAQIVFLAGIDKTKNKDICTFVAAVIHFLYVASFCWMLMEGVHLYRMVVKVFDAHMTMRYPYLFAFGFPLLVVAVSIVIAYAVTGGIYTYINPKYCWIRFDNGLIWSFVGPVLLLIAINSFFLFSVLKEIANMKSVKSINSFELSSLKASARACVVLLPVLGITWVFGLLSVVTTGVEWQYIFTVLNTTQGFFIFIFHCLRNTELRAAMELRYFQWESNHSSHNNQDRVTPSRGGKVLSIEETDKARANTIPMAPNVNKVRPM